MKSIYIVMAILASVTIVTIVTTISTQQVFAPRNCAGCSEFEKLTDVFEKDVINAASTQPPDQDRIQTLLGEYSDDVLKLFPSTSPS
jgi:hypothetical protein